MKRRYFLLSSLAGLAGLAGWRYVRTTDNTGIAAVLHKRLDYLALDETGVMKFADDLIVGGTVSSGRLRVLDAAGPLYTHLSLTADNKVVNLLRHGEDRVITLYLLSSDFFKNGADVSRIVHYLGFYNPMIPCGNPFARRPENLTTA